MDHILGIIVRRRFVASQNPPEGDGLRALPALKHQLTVDIGSRCHKLHGAQPNGFPEQVVVAVRVPRLLPRLLVKRVLVNDLPLALIPQVQQLAVPPVSIRAARGAIRTGKHPVRVGQRLRSRHTDIFPVPEPQTRTVVKGLVGRLDAVRQKWNPDQAGTPHKTAVNGFHRLRQSG